MMERIRSWFATSSELLFSKLGISFLLFTLTYTIAASLIPTIYLVEVANALVFAFTIVVAVFYVPDALWVARNDKGEPGQYFLVGISLVLLYLLEARAYATLWRWLGNPDSWLNNPFNTYFLFILVFGLSMLVTAPGMKQGEVPIKNWKMVALAIAFAVFVLGVTVGLIASGNTKPLTQLDSYELTQATCPHDKPIKGNVTRQGYIYHTPSSDYYSMTTPRVCFATEEEAKAKGFRAPRLRKQLDPGKQTLNDALTFAKK